MERKFEHSEVYFNTKDASIIVPEIIKIVKPKSVVDVGCGIGTWLSVFKDHGVTDVLGIDGKWTEENLVYKHLERKEYLQTDLEKDIHIGRKYDLVCCLEVAEHISEKSSDIFIESLTSLGNVILFSAAIPYQTGYEHVNLQWPSYWQEKFEKKGFKMLDILRYRFWDDENIFFWYKQNMFLVVHETELYRFEKCNETILNIVHPEMLSIIAKPGVKKGLKMLLSELLKKYYCIA